LLGWSITVDKAQRNLLRRRLRAAIEQQPEIEPLRTLLLEIGGVELVAPSGLDLDVSFLIDEGFLMGDSIICEMMERSLCHENVARLWKAKHRGLVGVGTGYALSDDGLWRQHSWGVRRSGILETTKVRMKYFGRVLQGRDANSFAEFNFRKCVLPQGFA
jgi:hypothetical protein